MYPPQLPEGMAAVGIALEIADVPTDVREQILCQTSPAIIRTLFTNWNKEFWKKKETSGGSPRQRLRAGLLFYIMLLIKSLRLIRSFTVRSISMRAYMRLRQVYIYASAVYHF